MLHIVRLKFILGIICASHLGIECHASLAVTNVVTATPHNSTHPPSPATCPSTSVNYITHGLPQQCLRPSPFVTQLHNNTSEQRGANATSATSATSHNVTATVSIVEHVTLSSSDSQESSDAIHDAQSLLTSSKTAHTSTNISSSNLTITATSETTTTAETTTILATISVDAEIETDSPLDNARFLSFEEWKNENLAQVGQSAEGLGQGRRLGGSEHDRKEQGINNGLDTLGDDSEIELDFSGFGGATKVLGETAEAGTTSNSASGSTTSSLKSRSKDAGKTGKERFNYASFDCAANVLKTNPRCKGSSRILSENKDSYMLNECKVDNKFIIVELCNDILVDTLVLANFEFFSSMFRTFRVSISDRYPIKSEKWKELGTFEARNSREIQTFSIENPLIWARYLKIDFLTHYGSEFYCPVSLVRVHGTTMMDEYRREEQGAGEADDEGDDEDDVVVDSVVAHTRVQSGANPVALVEVTPQVLQPGKSESNEKTQQKLDSPSTISASATIASPTISTTSSIEATDLTELSMPQATQASTSSDASLIISTVSSAKSVDTNATAIHSTNTTTMTGTSLTSNTSVGLSSTTSIPSSQPNISSSHIISTNNVYSSQPSSIDKEVNNSTHISPIGTPASIISSPSSTIHQTPSSSPPATQESFFKSINKRLQVLEANATLSLQYIESQSQLLRDAFGKVEKRQLAKTLTFLETLNATVSLELARFKLDYDQLWQSTVLELAAQREEGNRERELLGERVRMLADEMVGQKRIMAAQATALLVCAGLLIFTRVTGGNGHGDIGFTPVVQSMQASKGGKLMMGNGSGKSFDATRRRWKWDSPWMRSPTGTPRSHELRSEGEAEVDEEDLNRVMSRLSVGDTVESPIMSPVINLPGNEMMSDEVQDEEEETDEGEGGQMNADADDADVHVHGRGNTTTLSGLGKRPGVVGVQSAPTVPVLGAQDSGAEGEALLGLDGASSDTDEVDVGEAGDVLVGGARRMMDGDVEERSES